MIGFSHKGNFNNTEKFLKTIQGQQFYDQLNKYGEDGVKALEEATPKDTGKTASSWYYDIVQSPRKVVIAFKNSNVVKGIPIAIILQNGHATGTGGYVQGRDYINPAIQPVFDKMAEMAWKEVCGK